MTPLSVVADASPLIALEDLGLLNRCASLFASCLIPPAVEREIAPTVRKPPWIHVRPLAGPIDQRVLCANLDRGESEAIGLALAIGGHRVVIDERSARRVAASLGLSIVGTVGFLVIAKKHGIPKSVRPSLEALRASGFFLSEDGIRLTLHNAGEE